MSKPHKELPFLPPPEAPKQASAGLTSLAFSPYDIATPTDLKQGSQASMTPYDIPIADFQKPPEPSNSVYFAANQIQSSSPPQQQQSPAKEPSSSVPFTTDFRGIPAPPSSKAGKEPPQGLVSANGVYIPQLQQQVQFQPAPYSQSPLAGQPQPIAQVQQPQIQQQQQQPQSQVQQLVQQHVQQPVLYQQQHQQQLQQPQAIQQPPMYSQPLQPMAQSQQHLQQQPYNQQYQPPFQAQNFSQPFMQNQAPQFQQHQQPQQFQQQIQPQQFQQPQHLGYNQLYSQQQPQYQQQQFQQYPYPQNQQYSQPQVYNQQYQQQQQVIPPQQAQSQLEPIPGQQQMLVQVSTSIQADSSAVPTPALDETEQSSNAVPDQSPPTEPEPASPSPTSSPEENLPVTSLRNMGLEKPDPMLQDPSTMSSSQKQVSLSVFMNNNEPGPVTQPSILTTAEAPPLNAHPQDKEPISEVVAEKPVKPVADEPILEVNAESPLVGGKSQSLQVPEVLEASADEVKNEDEAKTSMEVTTVSLPAASEPNESVAKKEQPPKEQPKVSSILDIPFVESKQQLSTSMQQAATTQLEERTEQIINQYQAHELQVEGQRTDLHTSQFSSAVLDDPTLNFNSSQQALFEKAFFSMNPKYTQFERQMNKDQRKESVYLQRSQSSMIIYRHEDFYLDENEKREFKINSYLCALSSLITGLSLYNAFRFRIRNRYVGVQGSQGSLVNLFMLPLMSLTMLSHSFQRVQKMNDRFLDKYFSNLTDWGLKQYPQIKLAHMAQITEMKKMRFQAQQNAYAGTVPR